MNASVNGLLCSSNLNTTTYKIYTTAFYSLIFFFSLVGNSLIGIIVYKTRTLRKPINFLIVNMAMSDILYPLFLIPRRISDLHLNSWLIRGGFGEALCKLGPFLTDVSLIVSVESLVLVAVDRFGAVMFPLRPTLITSKRCLLLIVLTWIVALAVISPDLVVYSLDVDQGEVVCHRNWDSVGDSTSWARYVFAMNVVFIYIPMAILIILYSSMLLKLTSRKTPGEELTVSERKREKRNRNVWKLTIAIVVLFIVSWIPWSINFLVVIFTKDPLPCGFFIYWKITQLVTNLHCAINPCICLAFSGNYRQAFKKLFKCSRALRSQEEVAITLQTGRGQYSSQATLF